MGYLSRVLIITPTEVYNAYKGGENAIDFKVLKEEDAHTMLYIDNIKWYMQDDVLDEALARIGVPTDNAYNSVDIAMDTLVRQPDETACLIIGEDYNDVVEIGDIRMLENVYVRTVTVKIDGVDGEF